MSERWQQIWSTRPPSEQQTPLAKLMHADGYMSGFSPASEAAFRRLVEYVRTRAGMASGESVFEIGCGAGAFLLPLVEAGLEVGGLDFAGPQVELARAAFPGRRFLTAEASDYDGTAVDHVVSNGVFLYFPNLDYAQGVLSKALRAAGRSVTILDNPDAATRQAAEAHRRQTMGQAEYERAYAGLQHLYFDRSWFIEQAKNAGWNCIVEDQSLQDHPQARFRFNVFMHKR